MRAKIYLDVPYNEKDYAKRLGASWDSHAKKWFFEGLTQDIIKFGRWITCRRDEIPIIFECFHIIEAPQICFKCKRETRVIGFGIGEHSILVDEGNNMFLMDTPIDTNEIHLAWCDEEDGIPPLLLTYIKNKYNVKTGYSKVAGKTFANHCDCCGVIQGNFFLFYEDSPLNLMTSSEKELINRISQMKIFNIYTEAALPLKWSISYGDTDWAYTAYYKNKPFEDVILSETEELFTLYTEMYLLE